MEYRINDSKMELLIESRSKNMTDAIVEQLVAYRKKMKLTQQDIADVTGIQRANIARVETRRKEASLETLLRYAQGLNLELKLTLEKNEGAEEHE